jgi:hypothetical protein
VKVPPVAATSRVCSSSRSAAAMVTVNESAAITSPRERLKFVSAGSMTGSRSRSAVRSSLTPPTMTVGPSSLFA